MHKGLVVAFFDEHLDDAGPKELLMPGLGSKEYSAGQPKALRHASSEVASQTSTIAQDVQESRPDGGKERLSWLMKFGSRP
jgi:hypothetical protein